MRKLKLIEVNGVAQGSITSNRKAKILTKNPVIPVPGWFSKGLFLHLMREVFCALPKIIDLKNFFIFNPAYIDRRAELNWPLFKV
jgi:hypothetical protein